MDQADLPVGGRNGKTSTVRHMVVVMASIGTTASDGGLHFDGTGLSDLLDRGGCRGVDPKNGGEVAPSKKGRPTVVGGRIMRDTIGRRAWELLGNIQSRGVYDTKLQALRQDAIGAEDVTFEDLTVEGAGDVVEFLYQYRCSDYYSIDSLELGGMGFVLSRDRSTISLQSQNALLFYLMALVLSKSDESCFVISPPLLGSIP
ncbi:hypothetical protein RJ639_032042 [Escallonia herrerae]|uniref:Uncharacterized protein n=1 Tax=Escallonia herrerae TaxID=1293975 RepID=A0AA88X768_9ASTE|nr:hypothetical protein RJ639_032042 [Escallonia herrerae]